MARSTKRRHGPLFLGIEGGGTHTVALVANAEGRLLQRIEAGPANLRLLSDDELLGLLQSIATRIPQPDAVVVGLAGARTKADYERVLRAAVQVWPGVRCSATNDLETALAAAGGSGSVPQVLVLSGTGACCYGRRKDGKTVRVGGWGHLLGDRGSGYQIGLEGLKFIALEYDRDGKWPALGRRILRRIRIRTPDELIQWTQSASKSQIASVATDVFALARRGDHFAKMIVSEAVSKLWDSAVCCARQLVKRHSPIQFILAGGVLRQKAVRDELTRLLQQCWKRAEIVHLKRESAWGAVVLAQRLWNEKGGARSTLAMRRVVQVQASFAAKPLLPTEQRNPRSRNLDRMPIRRAIELMLSEDSKIPKAILAQRAQIELAVSLIVRAFKTGGRLFYVGAGTSGRLGVLDASECPPTFRSPPEMVQGIIAGGPAALVRAVEGAEDDAAAGADAVKLRGITRLDVVVGIAASGRTPFVWGALGEARKRGAKTVLITFNLLGNLSRATRPNVVIHPKVGPEVLTGSTRLKAGTATKLILNIFTTLAMVRIGKVVSNLMVDLNPSNVKLRDRATRIVAELTSAECSAARTALEKSGWHVRRAVQRISAATAARSSSQARRQ